MQSQLPAGQLLRGRLGKVWRFGARLCSSRESCVHMRGRAPTEGRHRRHMRAAPVFLWRAHFPEAWLWSTWCHPSELPAGPEPSVMGRLPETGGQRAWQSRGTEDWVDRAARPKAWFRLHAGGPRARGAEGEGGQAQAWAVVRGCVLGQGCWEHRKIQNQ